MSSKRTTYQSSKFHTIPFIGSKFCHKSKLNNLFNNKLDLFKDNETYYFIDVFGGSGALTLIMKYYFLNLPDKKFKVKFILNDYDKIIDKVDETLNKCNEIVNEIKKEINWTKYDKNDKLENTERINKILVKYASDIEQDDYLNRVLNSMLSFNGQRNTNLTNPNVKKVFWNRLRVSNFETDYLKQFDDVLIINLDFQDVFKNVVSEILKKSKPENIFLLLDPPYLYRDNSSYNMKFFKMNEYLKLIKYILDYDKMGLNIMLFESEADKLDDIFEFFKEILNYDFNFEKIDLKKEFVLINF